VTHLVDEPRALHLQRRYVDRDGKIIDAGIDPFARLTACRFEHEPADIDHQPKILGDPEIQAVLGGGGGIWHLVQ